MVSDEGLCVNECVFVCKYVCRYVISNYAGKIIPVDPKKYGINGNSYVHIQDIILNK